MKLQKYLFLILCFLCLSFVSVNAEWTGPDSTLREYTVTTTEEVFEEGEAAPCTVGGYVCLTNGSYDTSEPRDCSSFSSDYLVNQPGTCSVRKENKRIETLTADDCTASHRLNCSVPFGQEGWCGGDLTVTITGVEPKPGGVIIGAELSDGQLISATQAFYPFKFYNDVELELEYWVYSSVGDTSDKGYFDVLIDKTAPDSVECAAEGANQSDNSEWFGKGTSINVHVTDGLSGVTDIYMNVNDNAYTAKSDTGTFQIPDVTMVNVPVLVYAKDKANNNSDEEQCFVLNLDVENPEIVSYTNINDELIAGNMTFSMSATDAHSGVKSVTITIDDQEFTELGDTNEVTYDFTTSGKHFVTYKAIDNVNNTKTETAISFDVDIDAPVITINEPSMNGIQGLTNIGQTITGTVSDNYPGEISVLVLLPGRSTYIPATVSGNNWSLVIPEGEYPNGEYTIVAKAIDVVGNESNPAAETAVIIDTQAPDLGYGIESIGNGNLIDGWFKGSVRVSGDASDETSGVMEKSVSVALYKSEESIDLPSDFSGVFDIKVEATDYAGNKAEETYSEALKIDNTPPEADEFCDIGGDHPGEIYACVVNPYDELSGVKQITVYLDGQPAKTVTGPFGDYVEIELYVESGDHILYYEIKDVAENIKKSDNYYNTSDATPPTIEFTEVPEFYEVGTKSVIIRGYVEDYESGMDLGIVLYSFDDLDEFEELEIDENGDFAIKFNPDIAKQVVVRAFDSMGNMTEVKSKPIQKRSTVGSRINLPPVVLPNQTIRPYVINKNGDLVDDFSGIKSARAFVYGRGFDHRLIELSKTNNYEAKWDGKFPYGDGFIDATPGWYWLTYEITDINDQIVAYSVRVYVGPVEVKPTPAPVEPPAYTTFDINGIAGNIDNSSIVVNGTKYLYSDFSRVDGRITEGSNVVGRGRAYTKENVFVIETLDLVEEELRSFNGLLNDINPNYIIVDGYALSVDANTHMYCEDTRIGDYVSGLYKNDIFGNMYVTEFGPLSCERTDAVRVETGIADNN